MTDGISDGSTADDDQGVSGDASVTGLFFRAGRLGGVGSADGTGTAARFDPLALTALDNAGTLYIAERSKHTIRKMTAAGVVTTLAGSPGVPGTADGVGPAARFNGPIGVAADAFGNVYVSDSGNHTIRKIDASGAVSTLAGTAGTHGSTDGAGGAASFYFPTGLAIDAAGNIVVADYLNRNIRKVTPLGTVTTFAGVANTPGGADGTGAGATFNLPFGVAADAAGNVYVADPGTYTVRKITSAAVVTTLAGTAFGAPGGADGTGPDAQFRGPQGITVDAAGNEFVTDVAADSSTIRKITPAGVVTTIAGQLGQIGAVDGTGAAARFNQPIGVSADAAGSLLVADNFNHVIRKVTTAGVVTTIAGAVAGNGYADGTGPSAMFNQPRGMTLDTNGDLLIADSNTRTIRRITPAGAVTLFAGTANASGSADGTGSAARFSQPSGIVADGTGNFYVAEPFTIRKITAAGVVTTLAGSPAVHTAADGMGNEGTFGYVKSIAIASTGDLFVTDYAAHAIRRVTPAGMVSTFAGVIGQPGLGNGTGAGARFALPTGIAIDGFDNVYVSEEETTRIRKITPAGVVTVFAGTSYVVGSADGNGVAASFNKPQALAADATGNVFVADTMNATVRRITPAGDVTTLVGVAGRTGVIPGALPASLNLIWGIATTPTGNLVVSSENSILDVLLR